MANIMSIIPFTDFSVDTVNMLSVSQKRISPSIDTWSSVVVVVEKYNKILREIEITLNEHFVQRSPLFWWSTKST